MSLHIIYVQWNLQRKIYWVGGRIGPLLPKSILDQDFCLLFLKRLFVLWDFSCSGTWGWYPGSSACARKCFGTYPSPLSPEKKQVHDKCHEKIPSWMMLIKMVMLTTINDNTWSWMTLLLCMFALISSCTWGSGIIDRHGARSNSTIWSWWWRHGWHWNKF